MQPFPLHASNRDVERRALLPPLLLLEISGKCFIFYGKQGLMCSDNKKPELEGSVLSRAVGGAEWAHPPLVLSQLWHLLQESLPWLSPHWIPLLMWAHFAWLCNLNWMRILQKQPFEILHAGGKKGFLFKLSEIVKSNFEAWNKAFSFLGFWVLFFFFPGSWPEYQQLLKFGNIILQQCLLSPCYFIVSVFLSAHILPLEHRGTALFSQKAGDDLFKA